jgi:anti-anti-sigma factor
VAPDAFRVEPSPGRHLGQSVVRVSGLLNSTHESAFLDVVRPVVAPNVILDLTDVLALDSRGISALMIVFNNFKRERRRLALVGLQPRVAHILGVAGVLPYLKVFDSVAEAEEALLQME